MPKLDNVVKVLSIVIDNPLSTTKEIEEKSGLCNRYVRTVLQGLVRENWIRRRQGLKDARLRYYEVVKE